LGEPRRSVQDHAVQKGPFRFGKITPLLSTLRELAAIRSTAEDAAARILDSAEGLLALADKEEAQKAEEAILSIMTACGQRVTKIAETLDQVIATRLGDEEAGQMPTTHPAGAKSKIVLEGPRFPGRVSDQAQIDALFSEKN
jgi:hypothetical protein